MQKPAFILGALALAAMLAACGGSGPTTEKDGEGAVWSTPHASWGVNHAGVKVGSTWSAGGVLLCRTGEAVPTIASVVPVQVSGDVELDNIGVRTAKRPGPSGPAPTDTYLVGTMHGKPPGLQAPRGYVVPNDCGDGPDGSPVGDPIGEVVVTMTRTGASGGALDGLRVAYTVDDDDEQHVFDIHFHFGFNKAQSR